MAPDRNSEIATRHSLLTRLKDWGDEDSWKVFFDTYWGLIYRMGLRSGLREDEAEDVVQNTVVDLARNIKQFRCCPKAGSFKAYLRRLTKWRIIDRVRKRRDAEISHLPDESERATDLIDRFPADDSWELEEAWETEWQEKVLEAALERLRKRVNPSHFQLYDLFVLQGWDVARISRTVGASSSQVYHAKERVGQMLKREVERVENSEL